MLCIGITKCALSPIDRGIGYHLAACPPDQLPEDQLVGHGALLASSVHESVSKFLDDLISLKAYI